MDDVKRKFFSTLARLQQHNSHRHLQTDSRSVAAPVSGLAVRPHISLKARMLGGQAETISCLRGFMR
jgi:hypothetical protein